MAGDVHLHDKYINIQENEATELCVKFYSNIHLGDYFLISAWFDTFSLGNILCPGLKALLMWRGTTDDQRMCSTKKGGSRNRPWVRQLNKYKSIHPIICKNKWVLQLLKNRSIFLFVLEI